MKYSAIAIMVCVFLTTACTIETHSIGIQKGCNHISNSNLMPIPLEMVSQYYGISRKPDVVKKLDDGRTEIVYYSMLHGQSSSRHWSGYLVYFVFVPVFPLLFPDGHHGISYLVSNGLVVECTNFWHDSEGAPRFHI